MVCSESDSVVRRGKPCVWCVQRVIVWWEEERLACGVFRVIVWWGGSLECDVYVCASDEKRVRGGCEPCSILGDNRTCTIVC